ncbi:hypothetical protein H4V99_000131 [Cryobacterium sp. CG_9.6]|nr:hypothetical protein [Cryobacterium sp. CG_9.6]
MAAFHFVTHSKTLIEHSGFAVNMKITGLKSALSVS